VLDLREMILSRTRDSPFLEGFDDKDEEERERV
jgi:hypothetical protein